MAARKDLAETLRCFGLALPGAYEDHPWGELVLKAKKKVFVFLGRPGETLGFSVKLPRSGERLLDQDWAEPTAYGLGKSGWVTLTVDGANPLSDAELCALIEESYRAVAPKTLVKELDRRQPGTPGPSPPPAPSSSSTSSTAHGQRRKGMGKREKAEKSRAGALRSRPREGAR
jgi:predicted DNA-binding protein (MmcQ/YjbR family)